MKVIFKAEVPDEICCNVSSFKLIKIDLVKSENLIDRKLVKLPTATKALLKSWTLPVDKKCQLLRKCKTNLVALNKKLQEECPVGPVWKMVNIWPKKNVMLSPFKNWCFIPYILIF